MKERCQAAPWHLFFVGSERDSHTRDLRLCAGLSWLQNSQHHALTTSPKEKWVGWGLLFKEGPSDAVILEQ